MTKGRDIAAESLSDLLEVARVQQRSGMLKAEYFQNGPLEEGEIYLASGQPVYARTGRLVGIEAFYYLLSWRNIRFIFVIDEPRPVANIFSSIRPRQMTVPRSTRTQPLLPRSSPVTGGLPWSIPEQRRPGESPYPVSRVTPGIETLIPTKYGPERDIFSLGLTRRQRLIYFMIDGQRSLADLARTTNKTISEVELIVNELQEQGLIVF